MYHLPIPDAWRRWWLESLHPRTRLLALGWAAAWASASVAGWRPLWWPTTPTLSSPSGRGAGEGTGGWGRTVWQTFSSLRLRLGMLKETVQSQLRRKIE